MNICDYLTTRAIDRNNELPPITITLVCIAITMIALLAIQYMQHNPGKKHPLLIRASDASLTQKALVGNAMLKGHFTTVNNTLVIKHPSPELFTHHRNGEIFSTPFLQRPMHAIHKLLAKQTHTLPKKHEEANFLTCSVDTTRRLREPLLKTLKNLETVERYGPLCNAIIKDLLKTYTHQLEAPFPPCKPLLTLANAYVIQVLLSLFFGKTDPEYEKLAHYVAADDTFSKIRSDFFTQSLCALLENNRENPAISSSLLSAMQESRLSETEIYTCLYILIETALANAPVVLASTLSYLPYIQEAIFKEMQTTQTGKIPSTVIHAVTEGIRSHVASIATPIKRIAATNLLFFEPQINGLHITKILKGTLITIDLRESAIKESPLQSAKFDPNMVKSDGPLHKFLPYLPFGRGLHGCPAQWLVREMLYVALTTTVRYYQALHTSEGKLFFTPRD